MLASLVGHLQALLAQEGLELNDGLLDVGFGGVHAPILQGGIPKRPERYFMDAILVRVRETYLWTSRGARMTR